MYVPHPLLALGALLTVSATPTPSPRGHAVMVFDQTRGQIILIGGAGPRTDHVGQVMFTDTWAWDGQRWELLPIASPPRAGHALIYHPSHRGILLVGGHGEDGTASSFGPLLLRSTVWEPLVAAPTPERIGAAVAYDPSRGRVVAFGGYTQGKPITTWGDTREFDGDTWQAVAGPGPSPRHGAVAVHHPPSGKVVLFGGLAPGAGPRETTVFTDTWTWDGVRWSQIDSAGPRAFGVTAALDEARGEIVLLDGGGVTWGWTGREWIQRATTGPSGRGAAAVAYDPVRRVVVLFGGRNRGGNLGDTWEWDGSAWRQVA